MRTHDINTDIQVGRQIFDNIPNDIKPGWAGLILSRFDNYIKSIPKPVFELYSIIDTQDNWKNAHSQFSKIRQFLLDHKTYQPEAYLVLAENVAKVTYNASNEPAPFDNNSGWWIPSCALQAATYFEDNKLEEEVKSCILIFNHNKHLKNRLTVAKDFFIYKKIDDILWYEWDPIGVKDFAPRDEYQSYVPDLFNLKKSGADRNQIATALFRFETENMGMEGTLENCLSVADKILKS